MNSNVVRNFSGEVLHEIIEASRLSSMDFQFKTYEEAFMPSVPGVEVRKIRVNAKGSDLVISVKFKPTLPVLVDITVTTENGNRLGRAIINDDNSSNNEIKLKGLSKLIGQTVWLRVIIHHPSLNKYDFKIHLNQDSQNLTVYEESGSLNTSTSTYEGFVLVGDGA